MVFGRGKAKSQNGGIDILLRPTQDEDGDARVFPKEFWEGKHAELLREVGFSPDDGQDTAPSPEELQKQINARFDAAREAQDAFVSNINAQLPNGVEVAPWAMLPWSIWQREHAAFLLVTCGLPPAGPWNMMLLAEDDHSATILDLPRHPYAIPQGLDDSVNGAIAAFHQEFEELLRRTGEASDAAACSGSCDEIAAKVVAFAQQTGEQTFGAEVFARHRQIFGGVLGWPETK